MLLKKSLSKLMIISLSLIAISCANVPDVPVCKEIHPGKGWCSYTLTEGGFYVDDDRPYAFNPRESEKLYTWWEYRPMMMSLPPHSWGEFKKYIIKQCRITKKCRGNVGEWFTKMEDKK